MYLSVLKEALYVKNLVCTYNVVSNIIYIIINGISLKMNAFSHSQAIIEITAIIGSYQLLQITVTTSTTTTTTTTISIVLS